MIHIQVVAMNNRDKGMFLKTFQGGEKKKKKKGLASGFSTLDAENKGAISFKSSEKWIQFRTWCSAKLTQMRSQTDLQTL